MSAGTETVDRRSAIATGTVIGNAGGDETLDQAIALVRTFPIPGAEDGGDRRHDRLLEAGNR